MLTRKQSVWVAYQGNEATTMRESFRISANNGNIESLIYLGDMEFHQFKNIKNSIACFKKAMHLSQKQTNKKLFAKASDYWAGMINHHRVGGTIEKAFKIWKEAQNFSGDDFFSFDQPLAYHLRKQCIIETEGAYLNSLKYFSNKLDELAQIAYGILLTGYIVLLLKKNELNKVSHLKQNFPSVLLNKSGISCNDWVILFQQVYTFNDHSQPHLLRDTIRAIQNNYPSMNKSFILTIVAQLMVLVEPDNKIPISLSLLVNAIECAPPKALRKEMYLINPLECWKNFNKSYVVGQRLPDFIQRFV